jgi:hypothetical protein
MEGEQFIIFMQLLAGDLPGDDPSENAVRVMGDGLVHV